ncbi:MAG: hypothetical protein LBV43_05110 [Prevotella sp.]|jgi:hypothetical protein|nr:hypothetical protein [Prevotella sp.]
MIFESLAVLVLALISVIIIPVGVVWVLIRWNNKSSRNAGCIVTIVFFFISSGCGAYLIVKGVDIIKNYDTISIVDSLEKESDYFSIEIIRGFSETPFFDSIKSLQPAGKPIPENYMTYAGGKNFYRAPLIYPYSVTSIDKSKEWEIEDESGIEDIKSSSDGNGSKLVLSGITEMTFNKRILVGKRMNNDKEEYFILRFRTGDVEIFDKEPELKRKAYMLGFDTVKPMSSVKNYYNRFFIAETK